MTVFVLFFLPLLLSLGTWQTHRAEEKAQMMDALLERIMGLPASLSADVLNTSFQPVRLQGRFTDQIFLVDNQVHQGQVGYWVMQAFDDRSGLRVLVNRGWVAGSTDRSVLPEVITPADEVRLSGTVWPFTGLLPLLDEDIWTAGWPKRVQRLDLQVMSQATDSEAVEIRLDAGPYVAVAAPTVAGLDEARHRGYAATWFGLAIALVVLYVIWGRRRAREQT